MKYDKLTPYQLNLLLPKDSNWKVISSDEYATINGVNNLVVTAECKCGNRCQKMWSRLREGRFYSCGCIIPKGKVKDLDGEIWKAAIGYEGIYEVSNLGRLKRINKIKNTKRGAIQFFKEKLLSPHISRGYVRYILTDMNVKVRTVRAHVIIAKSFIPNPDNLPEVNHKDTIKHHNWVDNLEWSTHQDNMTHAKENGLLSIGENAYHAVLKEKDVIEIRKKYKKDEYTMVMIADDYGVSRSTIQQIIERRIWKHI